MWSKSRSRTCHSRYFSQKLILFYIGYPFQVPWLFLEVISEWKKTCKCWDLQRPSPSRFRIGLRSTIIIHPLVGICHAPGDSKCPFHPLVGGHLTPWKGHLTIPKRSLWITRHVLIFHDCCHLSFAENPANGPPPCLNGWSTAARIEIRPLTHPPGRATKFAGFGISFV